MRVIQIVLSGIPTALIPATESVKRWAGKSYETVKTNHTPHLDLRTASNFIRVSLLAENENTMVIDWDVIIPERLVLPNSEDHFIAYQKDCLMYSGKRTDVFEKMLSLMEKDPIKDFGNIYRATLKLTKTGDIRKSNVLPFNAIKHLHWSKNKPI